MSDAPVSKLSLFTAHPRRWQGNRYVYPVLSRRSRGLSIGVNLNPDKVCNFDCVYCCVDRTPGAFPVAPDRREVDLDLLRDELRSMLALAASGAIFAAPPFDATPAELRRVNDVAFSGDGEPTACVKFPDACRLVADELHASGLTDTKIVLITNATLLGRPQVTESLRFLDAHRGEVWAKLDAGTEAYYREVDRSSVPLECVLDNILLAGREREIVIQSLFMRLHGRGPTEAEIAAYVGRLRELISAGCRIREVQVYTVARQTAEAYVSPLDDASLDAIVGRVREVGIAAQAFYGASRVLGKKDPGTAVPGLLGCV